MALAVTNLNDVKVYRIGGSARNVTLPEWLSNKSAKALKADPEWRNRIELIQDLEFPEASTRVKTTRDGKYLMATGVYKPQIRVFEFAEMAMKFDRHTNCENVDFEILSDDWTRSVHLQADRTIEFHTQGGIHYSTRIPKVGRALSYHYQTCDLLVAGTSNEVWRLNLEQGRFLNSLVTSSNAINTTAINPAHQLFCFGGEDGHVELWDPRVRSRIARMSVMTGLVPRFLSVQDPVCEVTASTFRGDGLQLGLGTSTGHVLLYDLRHPTPLMVKDHQYGFAIKNVTWHDLSNTIVSADKKTVRIWDKDTGKLFTSIEPPADINDICVVPDSGLVFMASESTQMQTYYIPQLASAPKWCSFLDNITEELEESNTTTMYDDYRFVTRKELSTLALDHLIGTNVLKAYMHGFFIDLRLYERAKAIANPFAYDDYKKQLVRNKLDKQRESRISSIKKLPKINKTLAARLLTEPKNAKEGAVTTGDLMTDNRFKDLFTNPEYQVDENSETFQLLNPTGRKVSANAAKLTRLDSENENEDDNSSDEEEEEDDNAPQNKNRGKVHDLILRPKVKKEVPLRKPYRKLYEVTRAGGLTWDGMPLTRSIAHRGMKNKRRK